MSYRFRRHDVRQEEDVLPRWKILGAFFFTIVITLVLIAWAWSALGASERKLRPSGVFPERDLGRRRDVSGVQQDIFGSVGRGQALHRQKAESLRRWGWADKERRTVNLPIDEAMNLVLEESK